MRKPGELTYSQQRRSLWPSFAVSALFIAIGAGVLLLPHSEQIQTFHSQVLPGDVGGDTTAIFPRSGGPPPLDMLNPYRGRHEGFQGFVNIRPVPELVIPLPLPQDKKAHELAQLDEKDLPSDPVMAGSDTVVTPIDHSEAGFIPATKEPQQELLTRDVQVLNRVDPEYPFVAREAYKEGKINVLVYIDSLGNLTTFPDWIAGETIKTLTFKLDGSIIKFNYAIKEDPQDWFFGKNFLEVLPKWKFIPGIKEGKPVNTLLNIKYTFCIGANCMRYEIQELQSKF
ncbi:MAG: hypothetical protein WAW75_08360 [Gallionella sp.]